MLKLREAIKKIKTKTGSLNIDLSSKNIGNDGVKALADSIRDTELSSLSIDLRLNNVDDEGAKSIGDILKNTKLSFLNIDLRLNKIGSEGVKSIADGIKLTSLPSFKIDLEQNEIGSEGTEFIADGIKFTSLSSLVIDLEGNEIGDMGAAFIADGIKLTSLSSLVIDLEDNKIGDVGAKAIGDGIKDANKLASLDMDLDNNNIGDEGAQAIGAGIKDTNLSSLYIYLDYNNIGNAGAKSIGGGVKNTHITSIEISLRSNPIGDEGVQILAKAIAKSPAKVIVYYTEDNIGKEAIQAIEGALDSNINSKHRERQRVKNTIDSITINVTQEALASLEEEATRRNLTDEFNHKKQEIKQQLYSQIQELNPRIEQLQEVMALLRQYNGSEKSLIEYRTEFKSHECFKAFVIKNIQMCFVNTEVLIMPSEECESHHSSQCLAPPSWNIAMQGDMTIQNFLTTCLKKFEFNNFTPCHPLTKIPLTNGDIEHLNINTHITTIFSSDKCLEEFAKQNISMCLDKLDIHVISQRNLNQRKDGNTSYLVPNSWTIERSGCIQDQDIIGVCREEFEVNKFITCSKSDGVE